MHKIISIDIKSTIKHSIVNCERKPLKHFSYGFASSSSHHIIAGLNILSVFKLSFFLTHWHTPVRNQQYECAREIFNWVVGILSTLILNTETEMDVNTAHLYIW